MWRTGKIRVLSIPCQLTVLAIYCQLFPTPSHANRTGAVQMRTPGPPQSQGCTCTPRDTFLKDCGPTPAAPGPPGNMLEMTFLGSAPSLVNQKLWAWGPAIRVLPNSPDDSDASWSLRARGLHQSWHFCSSANYWMRLSNRLCDHKPIRKSPGKLPECSTCSYPEKNEGMHPPRLLVIHISSPHDTHTCSSHHVTIRWWPQTQPKPRMTQGEAEGTCSLVTLMSGSVHPRNTPSPDSLFNNVFLKPLCVIFRRLFRWSSTCNPVHL